MSITLQPQLTPSTKILLTGVTSVHGWALYQALTEKYPALDIFVIRPPKAKIPSGKLSAALCVSDRNALQDIRASFYLPTSHDHPPKRGG